MLILYLILINSYTVSLKYILYKKINRQCKAYYNCGPGYQILPCAKDFEQDICSRCPDGYVQPDLLSSSEDGNYNDTLCFPPTSECLATDITYRRDPIGAFCESLKGCRCDSSKCFYGDPCLCSRSYQECNVNKTMNDKTGECEPCPEGTEKNFTGCGPCRKIDPLMNNKHLVHEQSIKSHSSTEYIVIEHTPGPLNINSSIRSLPSQTLNEVPVTNEQLMIIFIAVLGLLAVLLIVLFFIICWKRTGFIVSGICWTNHVRVPRNGDIGNERQMEEQKGLMFNRHDVKDVKMYQLQMYRENQAGYPAKSTNNLYPDLSKEKQNESNNSGKSPCESSSNDEIGNKCESDRLLNISTSTETLQVEPDSIPSDSKDRNSHFNSYENEEKSVIERQNHLKLDVRKDNLQVSSSCSPITIDTEPHIYQFNFTQDKSEEDEFASGSYIPMYPGSSQRVTSGYNTESESSSGIFGSGPTTTYSMVVSVAGHNGIN